MSSNTCTLRLMPASSVTTKVDDTCPGRFLRACRLGGWSASRSAWSASARSRNRVAFAVVPLFWRVLNAFETSRTISADATSNVLRSRFSQRRSTPRGLLVTTQSLSSRLLCRSCVAQRSTSL
ncbi:unnamed protein product [Pelagomonas calceolata]|uniref:Uncharacterized protein n=1 Tax=Pelagomonas calceolata TaxID=35677 RepID=A0A8J2T0E5_9STRA|nr:unnamed protein product [Pelagomonas calceolata]